MDYKVVGGCTILQLEEKVKKDYYGILSSRMRTLQEIGDIFGITRERVRQLRNSGLRKLLKFIEEDAGMVLKIEDDRIIVPAVQCNICGDVVYSRTKHDYRSCSCGHVAVDGGFDYFKVVGNEDDFEITSVELCNVTVQDLYNDWKDNKSEYGLVQATSLPFEYECVECEGESLFYGRTKYEADKEAITASWKIDDEQELCPECNKKLNV